MFSFMMVTDESIFSSVFFCCVKATVAISMMVDMLFETSFCGFFFIHNFVMCSCVCFELILLLCTSINVHMFVPAMKGAVGLIQ